MTSSVIFYRIEAGSTAIMVNSIGYHKKQSARNIAQSGVNLALRQLGYNRSWRTGFSSLKMLDGQATVTLTNVTYAGIKDSVIKIVSVGTFIDSTATSTAYCLFPPPLAPVSIKALLTMNSSNNTNGNITVDGRDHNPYSLTVNAGKGTYAIWTTGSDYSVDASSQAGGTALSVDYAPASPPNSAVIKLNQTYTGGFPTTPDSVLGGPSTGYTEGTLKAVAQSGVAGSQYVTNGALLKYPLHGVTYVETSSGSPIWSATNVRGDGILIVHNDAKNAVFSNGNHSFAGLIIADDITHLHGDFWGGIISLTTSPTGNAIGNGSARILYSKTALTNATSLVQPKRDTALRVIAWLE
jgi:hypothetical protein